MGPQTAQFTTFVFREVGQNIGRADDGGSAGGGLSRGGCQRGTDRSGSDQNAPEEADGSAVVLVNDPSSLTTRGNRFRQLWRVGSPALTRRPVLIRCIRRRPRTGLCVR